MPRYICTLVYFSNSESNFNAPFLFAYNWVNKNRWGGWCHRAARYIPSESSSSWMAKCFVNNAGDVLKASQESLIIGGFYTTWPRSHSQDILGRDGYQLRHAPIIYTRDLRIDFYPLIDSTNYILQSAVFLFFISSKYIARVFIYKLRKTICSGF